MNAVAPIRRSPINNVASKENLRRLRKIALEIIHVGAVGEYLLRQSLDQSSSYTYLISQWQPRHEFRKNLIAHNVKKLPRVWEIALGCASIHEFSQGEKLRERLEVPFARSHQSFVVIDAVTFCFQCNIVVSRDALGLQFSPFLFACVVVQLHLWLVRQQVNPTFIHEARDS